MPAAPKHLQISQQLLAEIAAGEYKPSGRLPSEAQLVKRFGVSRPTVARALRDLQEEGLIERRAGSGSYVRNIRAPVEGQKQLGILVPELGTTEIFEVICGDLAQLARVHDYSLLWGSSDSRDVRANHSIDGAESLCKQFIERQICGVFFAPFEHTEQKDDLNHRLADRLRQAGIAVILLDRDLGQFPSRSEYDLIGIDNYASGYVIAEHLLKLGCARPIYLAPRLSAPTVCARIAGAREAILSHGLSLAGDFVQELEPDDPRLIKKLRGKNGTDAIICSNDRVAATLMQSLTKGGIQVPRDIRLVGFDDVKYATLISVPLTTMHQPCRDIAAVAFRAMQDHIADRGFPPRHFVLQSRLVVRESCGAYMKGEK